MDSNKSPNNLEKFNKISNKAVNWGKNFIYNAFNPTTSFPDYRPDKDRGFGEIDRKEGPPFVNTTQGPTFGRTRQDYIVKPYNSRKILDLVKRCPEVIGITNALITDIVSDGYHFEPLAGDGRNKVKKAEDFSKNNFLKREVKAAMQDWLILGDCALWLGKIKPKQLKEKYGDKFTSLEYKQLIDEDEVRSIRHVSWSTMTIRMNEQHTEIGGFIQKVQPIGQRNYNPKEIIHGKYMDWEGKAYGYSPIQASLSVVSSLNLIKDINGSFFDKGGVPDWVFILAKESPNSPRVKRLEQMLREYQFSTQKHGNMIMTGEVKMEELNKFDKDMEFRQHAIYLTGVLSLVFNMPLSRVASILGTEAKSGAKSEDASVEAYWGKISEMQDYWEQLLNTQLFEPQFGVSLRFNKNYLNNEIKEAQSFLQTLQYADQLITSGIIKNPSEFIYNKLRIPEQYRNYKKYKTSMDMMQEAIPGQAGGGPAPTNNPKVMEGAGSNAMRDQKKDEQNSKMTPMAKEFKEVLSLSFNNFKKLKDKIDTRKPMGMSGITHYTLINDVYIVHYATPDFKYRIEIPRALLSKVDEQEYILREGIQVDGMMRTVVREEVG